MQINFHSPDSLFTDEIKERCEEKLSRPVERYKLDEDAIVMDVDAALHRESVGLRVRFRSPGMTVHVSSLHIDLLDACDMAVAKLSRKISGLLEKRRDVARRRANTGGAGLALVGEEDFFTEDEEEVLREMGALDAVLEA